MTTTAQSAVETLASLPADTRVTLRGRSYFAAGPHTPTGDDGHRARVLVVPMGWTGDAQPRRMVVGHDEFLMVHPS